MHNKQLQFAVFKTIFDGMLVYKHQTSCLFMKDIIMVHYANIKFSICSWRIIQWYVVLWCKSYVMICHLVQHFFSGRKVLIYIIILVHSSTVVISKAIPQSMQTTCLKKKKKSIACLNTTRMCMHWETCSNSSKHRTTAFLHVLYKLWWNVLKQSNCSCLDIQKKHVQNCFVNTDKTACLHSKLARIAFEEFWRVHPPYNS